METVANIWRIERDGISAVKFEALAQIHFLSDVFVAIMSLLATARLQPLLTFKLRSPPL